MRGTANAQQDISSKQDRLTVSSGSVNINGTTIYPPTSAGSSGQVWTSDGAGVGKWADPSGAYEFDSVPTQGSDNLLTSGAIYTAINSKFQSDRILSLGHIVSESNPVSISRDWSGSGSASYKYADYDITYTSGTTTKNTSNGKIQITSTNSISASASSNYKDNSSYDGGGYYIPELTFPISLDSSIVPDGEYIVTFSWKYVNGTCTFGSGTSKLLGVDNGNFTITTQQTVTVTGGTFNLTGKLGMWVSSSTSSSGTLRAKIAFCFTEILQTS